MLTRQQRDTVIRTVAGEAATEGPTGWAAVAHVILNRSRDRRWPDDPASVAKQPKQFSTWNRGAGGNSIPRKLSVGSAIYKMIGSVVDGVFGGGIPDPTDGAVFYYAPAGMDNPAFGTAGVKIPRWLRSASEEGPPRVIGNHVFVGKSAGQAASPADASRAASGLQGYIPASTVPDPRLRPATARLPGRKPETSPKRQPTPPTAPVRMASAPMPNLRPALPPPQLAAMGAMPGPLLDKQRGRPANVPPVPPLGIPAPRYAVPGAFPGATGGDQIIRAALSGDPGAFGKATNAALGFQGNNPKSLTDYFTQFAKAQPAMAGQVAANVRGNPAFIDALPWWAKGGVETALTAPRGALPGNQVPTPRPRPATAPAAFSYPARPFSPTPTPQPSSASISQTQFSGRFNPPPSPALGAQAASSLQGYSSSGEQAYRSAAMKAGISGAQLDALMDTYRNRESIIGRSYPTGNSMISPELGITRAPQQPISPSNAASYANMGVPGPASRPPPVVASSMVPPIRMASISPQIPTVIPVSTKSNAMTADLGAKAQPRTSSSTIQVVNPAWTAWSEGFNTNPMAATMTTPPPKYITRPAPLSIPAITVRPAVPQQIRVPFPNLRPAQATGMPMQLAPQPFDPRTLPSSTGPKTFVPAPMPTVNPSNPTYQYNPRTGGYGYS